MNDTGTFPVASQMEGRQPETGRIVSMAEIMQFSPLVRGAGHTPEIKMGEVLEGVSALTPEVRPTTNGGC
jgi:hypothetical protein